MTPYQLLSVVACRVLGLYLIVKWICLSLSWIVTTASSNNEVHETYGYLIISLLALLGPIILGIILWVLAPWIGKRMPGSTNTPQIMLSDVPLERIQGIAISLLGLAFIVISISDLIPQLWSYFEMFDGGADEHIRSMQFRYLMCILISKFVKIGLGLWLFLGSRGFVNIFQSFNNPQSIIKSYSQKNSENI